MIFDWTHCCRGNPTVGALLQMSAPLSAWLPTDVVSCFHSTSPHVCPCRNQEQPCVLPDATQPHQIFRFHLTPCARETENTCKYQSERCYICARGPTIGLDIRLRGHGGKLGTFAEAFRVNKNHLHPTSTTHSQNRPQ